MINVKVSEGYAFDYLAILQIKCEIDPKKNFGNFAACVTNMIDEREKNKELARRIVHAFNQKQDDETEEEYKERMREKKI